MVRILILLIIISCNSIWLIHKFIEWISIYCNVPLSRIVVTGNHHLTTDDDIQILISKLNTLGTFITQDVNTIHEQIVQLPWIKQVSVRKQWPNILKIHLVEYIPKAYWNDDLVISAEGLIFRVSTRQINDNHYNNMQIPIFYGSIDKAQDILYNYLIFQKILESNEFHIRSLKMDQCSSWQLILKNDICLKLGRNNIIERLLYFMKIYPVLFQKINEQNKRIDYIDLRYRSGVAVKWMNNVIIPSF